MYRVLIVEDDVQILNTLRIFLEMNDYKVTGVASVAEGLSQGKQNNFDIFLFDVNLPDGNGIDLCRQVRKFILDVPILFMSANSDEEVIISGLGAGADDYIRKPFSNKELLARMNRAVLRSPEKIERLLVGPVTIDINQRRVHLGQDEVILTRCEFDILKTLARRPGNVFSRDQILDALGEYKDLSDRTVDSHISHLRAKLKKFQLGALTISASYGVGYKLEWRRE